MMTTDSRGHEAIRRDIAAYVLDAVEGEDRARIERRLLEHLPGCAECAQITQDFREIAGDLAIAAPVEPMSDDLQRRIMEAVREEPRSVATAPAASRRPLVMRMAAVAATLVLFASVATNVALDARLDDARARTTAMRSLLDLTAHPDARSIALRGQRGSVKVVYVPGGRAMLVGEGVPQPPEGHVLELWLLDGEAIPVRTFVPDGGSVLMEIGLDPARYRGAAITVERGFVRAPTTEPIYAGTREV